MEVKNHDAEEDMTLDDVDSVRNLLDRLKHEKERELRQAGSSSMRENENSTSNSKQDDLIGELQEKQISRVVNLKSVGKTKSSQGDEMGDNSKKRKQDDFSVEVLERAEVISKSARKGPETLVSSITQNAEGDAETEEFLKKIRAVPSASSEVQAEGIGTRDHRSKSASEVDLSVVVANSSQLNLEAQKSKITVCRSGSMKGRRKPTVSMRRRSLKSGFMDDWDEQQGISEGDDSMDEDDTGTGSGLSGGSFIFKNPPEMGANDEVTPRSKPKPKVKSKTVAGIALPGLADVLNRKNASKDDLTRQRLNAAEIVRAAAEGKKNQAAKEERVEKEPEKPAWVVEAEARRKLHERRRHNRAKQHEEVEPDQSNPLNEANKLHNVILRPVQKADPVRTKSEDDNGVSRAALNIRLRPVSKPEAIVTQTQEADERGNIKSHNVALRPVPKPESVVNDRTDDSHEKFYNVRLRPIAYPVKSRSSVSSSSTAAETNTATTRVYENGETSPGLSGTAKAFPQYHTARSLTPITSENTKVSEACPSHSSRSNEGGSRVTVSSDYVNAPHKVTPIGRLNNRTKTVTVTASEVPDPSTARRKSVEFVNAKVEWKGSSSASPAGHAVSRNAGDLGGSQKGTESRDTNYRPTSTGDVLPQWKIDLMEKKKNIVAVPARAHPTQVTNSVTVPTWKKQLADKRKQRVELSSVEKRNKENEPKISPEIPLWKKEAAERRKRREASPSRMQPEKLDRSAEIPEWRKKLSATRRAKPTRVAESQAEDPVDQVPSFMKEFEKKKKARSRGVKNASYV